jgi:ketosteroid isomerase-like protein
MKQTPIAEIIACETQLLEAMQTSNAELLAQLLHEQLLFNLPTGETATKAMDMANYRSGNIDLASLTASDRTIEVIGDNAVVVVTVEIHGNYMGQDLNGKFRYLRVWQHCDNRWQIIAGSVVPLPVAGRE